MNFSINTYSQVISSLTRMNQMDEYPYPLIVKGDGRPEDPESVKDRHQIYFQSQKKVLGGDCAVQYDDKSAICLIDLSKC